MVDAFRRSFRSPIAGDQRQRRATTNELAETVMAEETMLARLVHGGVMLEEETHLLGRVEETHHHRTVVQEGRVRACPVEDVVVVPHHHARNGFQRLTNLFSLRPVFQIGIEVVEFHLFAQIGSKFRRPLVVPVHLHPGTQVRNVFEDEVDVDLIATPDEQMKGILLVFAEQMVPHVRIG